MVNLLSNKKLYETITEVAGNHSVKVVEYIKDKRNISEFKIAEKTKLDMQTTRNILYKLHSHNIATYVRKKDRKKGWYISYWTFNRKRVRDLVEKIRKSKLEKLRERLYKEEVNKDNFYICEKACTRLDFDLATDYDFKCPECGSLLNLQENTKTIENIRQKIRELDSAS